jgi:hypothetical protein
MAITIEDRENGVTSAPKRVGRQLTVVSAVAIAAVLIAGLFVLSRDGGAGPAGAQTVRPIYTQDELTVLDLVDRGVLPVSVLDAEPFRTKRLVAAGIIPRATLDGRASLQGAATSVEPLYCPEELAVLRAVAAGTMPHSVLEREPFRTKALIAHGLIPRTAAAPC